VFGGDLFDHGPGDLRLATALVDFKARFPDRVHLIAGNRDLNKLRLLTELDEHVLALPPSHPSAFFPYWQQPKYVTTLAQYLERRAKVARRVTKGAAAEYTALDFVPKSWRETGTKKQQQQDGRDLNRVERLRWILRHTMGAPDAFENRRHELGILGHARSNEEVEVSDMDVFRSFQGSVEQGGIVRDYMEQTQLMLILGDSMYVHGAIRDCNVGWVPPLLSSSSSSSSSSTSIHTDAFAWCRALNEWQRHQMRAWRVAGSNLTAEPFFKKWERLQDDAPAAEVGRHLPQDHPMRLRAGGCLMDYGVPGGAEGKAVVHSSWLDVEHRPDPAAVGSGRVSAMITNAGIARVVTGHVPHGDCPTMLRGGGGDGDDNDSFAVLMCDTTYCAGTPGDWHSRGDTAVEVLVESGEAVNPKRGKASSCRIHGMFVDGESFDFCVEDWAQEMGKAMPDGRYVGHPRPDTGEFALWLPGKPFPSNLELSAMPFAEVRRLLGIM
jgi:hypothetical protein